MSPQELAEGLKAEYSSAFHHGLPRFIQILLDHGKDESAGLGEELSVVSEEYSQGLWQRKGHKSVGKAQQKIILHVLGEEKRSFLGARGAKMKTLAAKRPEELVSAFRIGALDTGDTSSIIAA